MATDHLRKILAHAEENGWEVHRQPKGPNIRLTKPGRRPVFLSPHVTDHRATKNALSLLRRTDKSAEGARA